MSGLLLAACLLVGQDGAVPVRVQAAQAFRFEDHIQVTVVTVMGGGWRFPEIRVVEDRPGAGYIVVQLVAVPPASTVGGEGVKRTFVQRDITTGATTVRVLQPPEYLDEEIQ